MKVVVVEDQALFKELLVSVVQEKLGHDVVGMAEDGETALEVIRQTRPDLILLDILIPRVSGFHVARKVQQELPTCRILAVSCEIDDKTLVQIHQMRLMGFVDKNDATVEVLIEAIQKVSQRKVYFSKSMLEAVRRLRSHPKAFQKILTPREQEVLTLIGAGMNDEQIGEKLGLTPLSAHSHRQNLLNKLDFHSTPELMNFAIEKGFWKPEFRRMDLEDSYHLPD